MRNLLAKIEAFLARYPGLSETQFGVRAIGDGSLIGDLRRGRRPRLDTCERIDAFMVAHARKARPARRRPLQAA